MKSRFPGYFKPSNTEINQLWEDAIFVLDANILLNLYRYSEDTKVEFLKILEALKDKFWIPNQSALEFLENRLVVIGQQINAYQEMNVSLNTIEDQFKSTRQHPFIKSETLLKLTSVLEEIKSELDSSISFHDKRITNDEILERFEILFDNKIGEEFSKEDLDKIVKEGELRYKLKQPPGYKDSKKKDDSEIGYKQYGDLIVWKQIIQKAKEEDKAVILITDDKKEDWWIRFKGKTVQPRPELIHEFKRNTNRDFYMYQSDRFMEYAQKLLFQSVDQKAINEIRELREQDEAVNSKDYFINIESDEDFKLTMLELGKVLDTLTMKRTELMDELYKEQLQIAPDQHPSTSSRYNLLDAEIQNLKMQESTLHQYMKSKKMAQMIKRSNNP